MGPFQVKYLGGASYVLIFIFDLSLMTFGYLLEQKDQTFGMFKEFKAFVENETNLRINILISDNGGEYISNEFNEFCAIKRQFTIPYTPQQNGVAERKIRSIMDMARCMLGNLPKFLLGEVVNSTIYTLNRCPTKAIEGKNPYEVWIGQKPKISYLRIFGYEAFSIIVLEKKKILDDKFKKLIFMGYYSQHKGYRSYSPSVKVMFVSRDVKLNEDFGDSYSSEVLEEPSKLPMWLDHISDKSPKEQNSPTQRITISMTLHKSLVSNIKVHNEPSNFKEASKHSCWMDAMKEEYEDLMKNGIWNLVSYLNTRNMIGKK